MFSSPGRYMHPVRATKDRFTVVPRILVPADTRTPRILVPEFSGTQLYESKFPRCIVSTVQYNTVYSNFYFFDGHSLIGHEFLLRWQVLCSCPEQGRRAAAEAILQNQESPRDSRTARTPARRDSRGIILVPATSVAKRLFVCVPADRRYYSRARLRAATQRRATNP